MDKNVENEVDLLAINLPYEIPWKLKNFSRSSRSPCVTL